MALFSKLSSFYRLMRLNRPIGIFLVLWPTLWGLWIAAKGAPRLDVLLVFVGGVVLMRSAGCVINDFADRKLDGHVKRTQQRPLVTGEVSSREAVLLFLLLVTLAFVLVLHTNRLTLILSLGAVALAFTYPFVKRHSQIPQIVLGAAFAWSIPMAFAAQSVELSGAVWLLFTSVILWTAAYDTFYAMVDREDDLKIGIKSTAILFGDADRVMTGCLQFLTLLSLALAGAQFELGRIFQGSLVLAACLFLYQQYLIRHRDPQACFRAFRNNSWVGMIIFIGIVADCAQTSGSSEWLQFLTKLLNLQF